MSVERENEWTMDRGESTDGSIEPGKRGKDRR